LILTESPFADSTSDNVTVEEFTDPATIAGVVEVFDQDAVQLEPSPFYAKRTTVPLDHGVLVHHTSNSKVRTHTVLNGGYAAFVAVGPGTSASYDGFDLKPDRIFYMPDGSAGEFVVAPDYRSSSLLIAPDHLQRHLRLRGRARELGYLEQPRIWQPPGDSALVHFELGERIAELASREPSRFDAGRPARVGAHIDLLESLLALLTPLEEVGLEREERTRHTYSDIVKQCEAYALEKGSDHLYVTELCERSHVSERTLQYAFQSVLGMAPTAYLNRMRLTHARKHLLQQSFSSTTVSKIALDWGFWHFGDFARKYKALFDESPSATLRQPPP